MKNIVLFVFFILPLICLSQATGSYIKDAKGCMVWNEEPSPKDSVSWSGDCKNNYASGTGILQWYRDKQPVATYSGQMKNGKPEGKGKYVFNEYARYEGKFSNGVLNGKGAIYFNNGGKMIGNFSNGNFLNLDGKYLSLLKKQYPGITDTTGIYYGGSDNQLFYYALVPVTPIKAVIALFPSTGETAENVISCNRLLMQSAYEKGILTIVLSANYNNSIESDPGAMAFFETVFKEVVSSYKAPKDKFILMGFSLGGENALLYTEMSRNKKYNTYIKPLAVIGVDPPVDMTDLYNGAKNKIVQYGKEGNNLSESKKIALNECHYLLDYFHRLYGGSPVEFPEKYMEGSQFSRNREDGGNAKFLVDVPVRLYCDPDILWQLNNKGRDYYQMNAANLSAMINFLMQNGNKRAELIPALGKGFRVDGTRHPHSWSIVEPTDCINWVLGLTR